ncbi:unnamed protein product [Pylaiella littoralis]
MGNDMSRTAVAQSHGGRKRRTIIESPYAEAYQRATLEDISNCLLRRDREVGRYKMAVNSAEFRQIFGGLLANPTELFSHFDTRGKGLVDVSEAFASAFLFAARTPKGLDAKLEKVWQLFDFDRNGRLGSAEAEIMLECVVRGASRVAMIPQPEDVLDSIGKLTASLVSHSKRQATGGELTLRDLREWISEREDVSAFLSKTIDARLIISSRELVEESVALGMSMCTQTAPQDEESERHGSRGVVDGARAREVLRSLATVGKTERLMAGINAVTDADADAVVRMLTGGSGSCSPGGRRDRVDLEALEELMRSWVAFSVVDEDGAGSVCIGDLKARRCNTSALLWLGGGTAGEEPPEATVQKTANDIDEGQDGSIKRMQWMRYTAVLDEGIGNVGYDGGLLKVFRRYDDDRSGSITANEMTMMVRDSVAETVAESPGSCVRPCMEKVLETLVKDIARDLVTVIDVGGSGMIGWTEFKKNQTLVTTRLATLREFVSSVALQRGGAVVTTAADDTSSERNSSSGSRPENNNATSEEGSSTE